MKPIGRNGAWRIAARFAKRLNLPIAKARPDELLLVAPLTSDSSKLEFYLKHEIQNAILPGVARGLLDRDSFVASAMAIGIIPVPVIATVEHPTAAAPVYYPDPNVFDEATAGLPEYQALESMYYAVHSIQTNEGVRIDKSPNLPFRTVLETQSSATTVNMQNGIELKEIGAAIRFGGGDENLIWFDLRCKDKTNIAGNANRKNYAVIRLSGAIIKGSTTKVFTS